jgi:hypothetical protein
MALEGAGRREFEMAYDGEKTYEQQIVREAKYLVKVTKTHNEDYRKELHRSAEYLADKYDMDWNDVELELHALVYELE